MEKYIEHCWKIIDSWIRWEIWEYEWCKVVVHDTYIRLFNKSYTGKQWFHNEDFRICIYISKGHLSWKIFYRLNADVEEDVIAFFNWLLVYDINIKAKERMQKKRRLEKELKRIEEELARL